MSAFDLSYCFGPSLEDNGAASWRSSAHEGGEVIRVLDATRGYSGGFSQHALNHFVAQAVLRERPAVLYVDSFEGCTVDLPRVAALLGIPVVMRLGPPAESLQALDASTTAWLRAALSSCSRLLATDERTRDLWPPSLLDPTSIEVAPSNDGPLQGLLDAPAAEYRYDYSVYEFCQRDHPLLVGMQRPGVRHFEGCSNVLDLACGVGIFLACLADEGIAAMGVERDARIAEYARGMGLQVVTADALEHLGAAKTYDGIHCSHFIEHLPVEGVQKLLELALDALEPGGVLVLVFPDPESIRSQLLGFWRDPEHVRFYHPELVMGMATAAGFLPEYSSYEDQPHRVVSFAEDPPPVTRPTASVSALEEFPADGPLDRLLGLLGLASRARLTRLEKSLANLGESLAEVSAGQVAALASLEARTDVLWDVSRTWAWNDNVTLRLRKPAR